jgi:hypothetical protein
MRERPSCTLRPAPANIRNVSAARSLSLELADWSTRPVGHITDESGHRISFDGWLSLATALERICGDAEEPVRSDDSDLRADHRRLPA